MRFSTTLAILFGLLASTYAQDGPHDSFINCGSETISDAQTSDCAAACEQIDKSAIVATDPADALRVVTKDPATQWVVMHEVRSCQVAGLTRVPLTGGAPIGTVFSGQVFYDLCTALLDCEDTSNGKVNGEAGIGQQAAGIGSI